MCPVSYLRGKSAKGRVLFLSHRFRKVLPGLTSSVTGLLSLQDEWKEAAATASKEQLFAIQTFAQDVAEFDPILPSSSPVKEYSPIKPVVLSKKKKSTVKNTVKKKAQKATDAAGEVVKAKAQR
jgi:hypothetical protein